MWKRRFTGSCRVPPTGCRTFWNRATGWALPGGGRSMTSPRRRSGGGSRGFRSCSLWGPCPRPTASPPRPVPPVLPSGLGRFATTCTPRRCCRAANWRRRCAQSRSSAISLPGLRPATSSCSRSAPACPTAMSSARASRRRQSLTGMSRMGPKGFCAGVSSTARARGSTGRWNRA